MAAWIAKAPECRPLQTVDQLLQWEPQEVDEILKTWVPLDQALAPIHRPRLLACHDMRGGYLEDRLAQGGGDSDFYTFRHWHAIDLFVYFSHSLVTIPPVGWVNAGHCHGVPVLGTLITEWEEGAAKCRQLFGSPTAAERTASQLAAIAQTHGFDGWIINIENKLDKEHVPHVIHFLRVLSGMMRESSPVAQVIWYDAVTVEGELKWQDSLTDLNKPFFEASTGIWINYTWKEGTPQQVRAVAGERQHDVYMGVDVFGRGTFGGGGFHCDVALTAAKAAGLSAALFAVAWPFDAEPGEGDTRTWQERDEALWSSISEAWGACRPVARQLPFYTDFSLGCGRGTLYRGFCLHPAAWYNLSQQGLQPSLRTSQAALLGPGHPKEAGPVQQQGTLRAAPTLEAAYSGGSCIEVGGTLQGAQLVSLFHTAIPVPEAGLDVGYAAAACGGMQTVLALSICSGEEGAQVGHILLLPHGLDNSPSLERLLLAAKDSHPVAAVAVLPAHEQTGMALEQGQQEKGALRWLRRMYAVLPGDLPAPAEQCVVTGVDLLVLPEGWYHGESTAAEALVYLGELWMQQLGAPAPPCYVTDLACSNVQLLGATGSQPGGLLPAGPELSACLSWSMPAAARCCHVYCIFHTKEASKSPGEERRQWLGVAVGPAYRVHSLLVPQRATSVSFYTQPLVRRAGKLQPWEAAGRVDVALPVDRQPVTQV